MKTLSTIIVIAAVTCLASCKQKPNEADLYNTDAVTPDAFNPTLQGLKPINEVINPAKKTIAILYANKTADSALLTGTNALQKNAVLELVTWQLKADPHWFGVNIPGKFISLEKVDAKVAGQNITTEYRRLNGSALSPDPDTLNNGKRKAFILALRPAIMP